MTETAKRTLVLNTLCNEERKESSAQGKKARTTQVQSREKIGFWTEEESKNETRQVQSKKEKRFWTGEDSNDETSSGARRRLFQHQKLSYFIDLIRALWGGPTGEKKKNSP